MSPPTTSVCERPIDPLPCDGVKCLQCEFDFFLILFTERYVNNFPSLCIPIKNVIELFLSFIIFFQNSIRHA